MSQVKGKRYTEEELMALGMDRMQIKAILDTYAREDAENEAHEVPEGEQLPAPAPVVHLHEHKVQTAGSAQLKVTTLADLETYKQGTIVELPPFAEGQPLVARVQRPSMLAMVKSGKISNTLINEATALFVKGNNAMVGKDATTIDELYDVIETIVDAALLEPSLSDIRNAGLELCDDQLMAIFSYTQTGVKALEQFRTK